MKTLQAQKKMAAKMMGVGKNKVWFDPERISEIKEAITNQDILDLIKDEAISKGHNRGIKRRAGRVRLERKRKGRRRRAGKIKKKIVSNTYIHKIRKLRFFLKNLKKNKKVPQEKYKKVYNLLKSGVLKNNQQILDYINKNEQITQTKKVRKK